MKRLGFVFLLLISLCFYNCTSHAAYPTTTEHHKVYPYTSVMASPYSCDPTGTLDIAASLEQIKANQSNIGTIHFPAGTYKLSTAFTLPVGMTFRFEAGSTLAASADVTINGRLNMLSGGLITIATTKTLTINGPLEAGSYQIFSCTGTGKVVFGDGAVKEVYPEWWGAVGDETTDCTIAINAATATATGTGIEVSFGIGTYLVNSTLRFEAIWRGVGPVGTVIKAAAAFSGTTDVDGVQVMVDFCPSPVTWRPALQISDIRFEGSSVANLAIFGATTSGGDGNATTDISRVHILNGVYGIKANNAITGPGAFTGTKFHACSWSGNDISVQLLVNQDDIEFDHACRFDLQSNSTGVPITLAGGNIKFHPGYVNIGNLYNLAGIKVPIHCIGYNTSFDGIFFETNAPASDMTHLFYFGAPYVNYNISNLYINIGQAFATMVALARTNVGAWSDAALGYSRRPEISFNGVTTIDAHTYKLVDTFIGSEVATDFLTVHMKNLSAPHVSTPPFQWGAGSSLQARDTVYLYGVFNGLTYHHGFQQSVGSTTPNKETILGCSEGTWTPTLGGTATYTTQQGRYIKKGKLVFVTCDITVNALGTGSTTTISGLPFATAAALQSLTVSYFGSLAVNVLHIGAYIGASGTTVSFVSMTVAGATCTNAPAIFGDGARVVLSGCYEATSY